MKVVIMSSLIWSESDGFERATGADGRLYIVVLSANTGISLVMGTDTLNIVNREFREIWEARSFAQTHETSGGMSPVDYV